jgi:hypothetical protein
MSDVSAESSMDRIQQYIQKRRSTIAIYIANQPILEACRQREHKHGLQPRQWWWEQAMCFNTKDAIGSDE